MNFNFFDWLRDGVKRSVLIGVSDAVQTMGMPPDEESSRDKILSFLQEETQAPQHRRLQASSSATGGQRKRIGRTIDDLHAAKEAG